MIPFDADTAGVAPFDWCAKELVVLAHKAVKHLRVRVRNSHLQGANNDEGARSKNKASERGRRAEDVVVK